MLISELETKLRELRASHGDMRVFATYESVVHDINMLFRCKPGMETNSEGRPLAAYESACILDVEWHLEAGFYRDAMEHPDDKDRS